MLIRSEAGSILGRVRATNDDAYGCFPELRLYVVADGIGGRRGGQVASQAAVDVVSNYLLAHDDRHRRGIEHLDAAGASLEIACRAANETVRKLASGREELEGMGTTIAALHIDQNELRATIAHAGDSRVYRLRDGRLDHLTTDHTLAAQLVREGRLTSDEAMRLRHGGMLTKAVGIEEVLTPDVRQTDIQAGDLFLLSTDGLHANVPDDQILDVLCARSQSLSAACRELLELADACGGNDNATVVLARCAIAD